MFSIFPASFPSSPILWIQLLHLCHLEHFVWNAEVVSCHVEHSVRNAEVYSSSFEVLWSWPSYLHFSLHNRWNSSFTRGQRCCEQYMAFADRVLASWIVSTFHGTHRVYLCHLLFWAGRKNFDFYTRPIVLRHSRSSYRNEADASTLVYDLAFWCILSSHLCIFEPLLVRRNEENQWLYREILIPSFFAIKLPFYGEVLPVFMV